MMFAYFSLTQYEEEVTLMFQWLVDLNGKVNDFVWGVPAMILIMGVGIYLSCGTRFIQFRRFGTAMRATLGRVFKKEKAGDGSLTPFQALCTALSATVGTGNIAGVAGAIAIGGPGAVFWMWISALLGMCTKFAEVTLAVKYRQRNEKGDWAGGPMYYIENGLGKKFKWLAVAYAALGTLACFGIGNATQVNSIKTAITTVLQNYNVLNTPEALNVVNWVIGIALALILMLILLGGIKRIGSVAETLVPFMAIMYIVLGLGVVIANISKVPAVFGMIFESAFNPAAVTGGVVGSFFIGMKKGVSRGIFSNEAGLGTGSIAHACADTDRPVHQGYFGVFEVFTDTIVICTLTALIILCSGVPITWGEAAGADLTISGFVATYGNWSSIVGGIALICFAFSTVLGWSLYGARFVEYLFGQKATKVFMAIFSVVAILGATMDLGVLWDFSDTFNGLMAIPNLIGLLLLGGGLFKTVKEYKDDPEDLSKAARARLGKKS